MNISVEITKTLSPSQLVDSYYKSDEVKTAYNSKYFLDIFSERFGHRFNTFDDFLEWYARDHPSRICTNYYTSERCVRWAFHENNEELIEKYLREGAVDVNTAYILAAEYGKDNIMSSLRGVGADANEEAFVAAFVGKHLDLAIFIEKNVVLQRGDTYNSNTSYPFMPYSEALLVVCQNGYVEGASWLANKKTNVSDITLQYVLRYSGNNTKAMYDALNLPHDGETSEEMTSEWVDKILQSGEYNRLRNIFHYKDLCLHIVDKYFEAEEHSKMFDLLVFRILFAFYKTDEFLELSKVPRKNALTYWYRDLMLVYNKVDTNPGNLVEVVKMYNPITDANIRRSLVAYAAKTGNLEALKQLDLYPFTRVMDNDDKLLLLSIGDSTVFRKVMKYTPPLSSDYMYEILISLIVKGKRNLIPMLYGNNPDVFVMMVNNTFPLITSKIFIPPYILLTLGKFGLDSTLMLEYSQNQYPEYIQSYVQMNM